MVLQRNARIEIWGTGSPAETIKIVGSWDRGHAAVTIVGKDGRWQVNLKTTQAGGPYTLKVSGSSKVEFTNVMLGEVWLCGGQSNMEFPLSLAANGQVEVSATTNGAIRFFNEAHMSGQNASASLGAWLMCSPETAANCSAVAYFFGRELHRKLGVPIGLINASWGCTHIEEWIDRRLIENDPMAVLSAKVNTDCNLPGLGNLFDGMIAPLVPYRIAGFIWYQGESNRFMPGNYETLMEILIGNWRSVFGKRLPFYFVQIAPFNYNEKAFIIREKQASVKLPHTGMVVISDLVDDLNEIHPHNKLGVGKRLANLALAETYGKKVEGCKSPMYKQMKVDHGKVRVYFENAGEALICKDKGVYHCRIAGADKKFVDAEAQVEGNTLLVGNDAVKDPVAVRFCFDNNSIPNVFSREGLPVAPFRTDNWPLE